MWTIDNQQVDSLSQLLAFEQSYPQLSYAKYADPLSSHAFLIHGQEPCNLLFYTEHLVQRLICDRHATHSEPCGDCEGCHAYQVGNPERLIELFPQGSSISISQIREMVANLNTKLAKGKKQIVILYYPSQMQKEAANALLKTLEEPPSGRVFILVNPYQKNLLATIQSRVMSISIPSAELQFNDLDEFDRALMRLATWNLQSDTLSLKKLLEQPLDLATYLRRWLEKFQDEEWSSRKLLQDQIVNPVIHASRKLGVFHFLDELAIDEFNYLDSQVYKLEKIMNEWSDWIEGEGSRVSRSLRQELGESYLDPYVGDGSKANLQRFYRGFCIREIESIFTEILVSLEWLLLGSSDCPVLPQEKQIGLNYENLCHDRKLYELSHRLVELRRMLYNNHPWSNLIEQLGMTLIRLRQS